MADVTMTASGQKVSGWTSVTIHRSVEQVAHEFTLEATNSRLDESGTLTATGLSRESVHATADVISTAEVVKLAIDGNTIITGYIDDFEFSYDAQTATVRATGRSKTGDLVDCSAIHGSGVWTNADIVKIASDLCEPFGISVSAFVTNADHLKKFDRFRLDPGETVFEALTRAAEMRGVLLLTDQDGNLTIERASTFSSGATIALGENILRGTVTRSLRERFSDYLFKGQSGASDEWYGKNVAQISTSVSDDGVLRYRPLVVIGQKQRAKDDLAKRAANERNVRAGRATRYRYTVPEWTTGEDGALWDPNTLARVVDPWCDADTTALVTSVEFVLDLQKRETNIDLLDRSAFDVMALPPKKNGRSR